MRSHPGSYRLLFSLPRGSQADSGWHQPSPEGCTLNVTPPLVEILGPSREATFEQAARLLRITCRGQRGSISALLSTPARPSGRDSWSIVYGADVSFSPTSIDPYLPRAAQRPPPALELVAGGRST